MPLNFWRPLCACCHHQQSSASRPLLRVVWIYLCKLSYFATELTQDHRPTIKHHQHGKGVLADYQDRLTVCIHATRCCPTTCMIVHGPRVTPACIHDCSASLGVLDMSQTSAAGQLHASTLMVSAMPSHTMQLPMPTSSCILPPSTTTHFIPVDAAHPTTTPTFLPPPHLASQQSADSSSCTIIVTQHQQHTHFPMQHASLPLSNLSLSAGPDVAAAESAALQHQSSCASEEPAKKKAPGRRKRAAKSAAVAPVPGCDSAQGMAERPVRRKRGPYKKRVKGEAKVKAPKVKAPSGRKRKAISLLPAVQAFRLQGMQMQASAPDHPLACLPTADQPGPSKRAR